MPVEVKQGKETVVIDKDEHPRQTSLEALAKLTPAFKPDGMVTAANASGINDGAAAVVLMSATKAKELGLTPKLKLVARGPRRASSRGSWAAGPSRRCRRR